MLKETFLLDDFEISGQDADEFEHCVSEIDRHTAQVKRCLNNFIVVSAVEPAIQDGTNERMGWYLEPSNPSNNGRLKACSITRSAVHAGQMEALLKETPTLLWDKEGNATFFLSDMATNTLAQRIGVSGDSIRAHSLERDMFIAKKLDIQEMTTLIVKQYRQLGKIFVMMGENYVYIPLHELCVIYKDLAGESKLGAMECVGWNITHRRATISFAFSDYAKEVNETYKLKREMVPGVEMTTSDIGACSFVVRGYWKIPEGAIVYDHTYSREHRGKVDPETIEKEVCRQIFGQYNQLPERLVELGGIDITPPGLNLQGARDSGKNHKAVCRAFHDVFKQLKIVEAIGKKRLMSLEQHMDYRVVQGNMHYTAYDVVMDVFALTVSMEPCFKKEGVSQETIRKFRECVSKAAYVNFNFLKKGGKGEGHLSP